MLPNGIATMLLLARIFLLLLLAAEWYGDPSFGRDPYSQSMRSQLVVNAASQHRDTIGQTIRLSHETGPLFLESPQLGSVNAFFALNPAHRQFQLLLSSPQSSLPLRC